MLWGYSVLTRAVFANRMRATAFGALIGFVPLLGYTLILSIFGLPTSAFFWRWWLVGLLPLGLIFFIWLVGCLVHGAGYAATQNPS